MGDKNMAMAQRLRLFNLAKLGQYTFKADAGDLEGGGGGGGGLKGGMQMYGGQMLAHGVLAGYESLPMGSKAQLHSVHANFISAGSLDAPVKYEVKPLRDGSSFCTRSLSAEQAGELLFAAQMSFCPPAGVGGATVEYISHQDQMPAVPPPEQVRDTCTVLRDSLDGQASVAMAPEHRRTLEQLLEWTQTELRNFEQRPVDERSVCRLKPLPPIRQVWMKPNFSVGNSVRRSHATLAYLSDVLLVTTALHPHYGPDTKLTGVRLSLDHALWLHRHDFDANDWLLYDLQSSIAANGRGFVRGSVWTRDKKLIASVAQESLLRLKKAPL